MGDYKRKIAKQIKSLLNTYWMCGLDVIGSCAFDNMECMDRIEKKLDRLVFYYWILSKFKYKGITLDFCSKKQKYQFPFGGKYKQFKYI